MSSNARRRIAGLTVAGVLAVAGAQWAGTARASGPQAPVERVSDVRRASFWWFPTTSTTKAPTTTTTKAPTTTAAPATTTAPAPTAPPTTKAPTTTAAPTTTRPPTTTTKAPTTTVAPTPTVAPAPTGALSSASQQQLLALVNAKRATGTTCGGTAYPAVPALSLQGQLTQAADAYARDMATYNYFSHTGRDGSDPGTRISRTGYRWSAWAENIAAGQPTADAVVAGWFASAGHCVNFMSRSVTQVGFGMAQNSASTYKIYWVADLGRPA